MKKLARLSWIRRTFGDEYVQDYFSCYTWPEIVQTAGFFETELRCKWGLRTDYRNGTHQGFNLPFLYNGTVGEAQKVWLRYGTRLVYIVTKKLDSVRLNGVALPVSREHVLIEWNERESTIAQRYMYRNPENVRRGIFGPGSQVCWNNVMWRVYNPRHASWWRFDRVYALLLSTGTDEITFSVSPKGRLVIW